MDNYQKQLQLYYDLKGISSQTIEGYTSKMDAFVKFYKEKDQDKDILNIAIVDIQKYIVYLKNDKKLSAGTINIYISAIRFFYIYVLGKDWNSHMVPRMRRIITFPYIPSRQEVMLLLNAPSNLKHKAILYIIYGGGLRVSEVAKLKIGDINSKTMSIRIGEAKYNTNRYTILSKNALMVLRKYFKSYFTKGSYTKDDYLFPGAKEGSHLNVKSIKNTIIKLRTKLALNKNISSHTLRHAFATHLLEEKVDIALIQQLLGHKNLKTTAKYLHMTSKSFMGISSPLDVYGKENV